LEDVCWSFLEKRKRAVRILLAAGLVDLFPAIVVYRDGLNDF
jgi:hypothetical protein